MELYMELMHTESREGFDIWLHFMPEHDDPAGHFATGDDDADAETVARIRHGDLLWFVARVSAHRHGVELATDYLGGCCYESAADFIAGDYYADMVENVICDARGMIAALALGA
jgi:hypothetical protein